MDYLVKTSHNPDHARSNPDELKYCDKKSIIKQNNWAICSFNSIDHKNNNNIFGEDNGNQQNYNPDFEKLHSENNPFTINNELNVDRLNKLVMDVQMGSYNNYHEDSTEDLDEKVSPMSIKLPV
mmetsp:Transcript_2684/g.3141  ORF Transcript_2684/g.3141 Transcript_2684/m.3141 type:complete len:124 (+) Transcript_2684:357-728(+)